jgi:hypothetical protein
MDFERVLRFAGGPFLQNFCRTLIAVWRRVRQSLSGLLVEQETRSFPIAMKTRLFISRALLPLLLCPPLSAEESNPFRKVPTAEPAAAGSPAGPFVSLCEHILVPRKILDAWLDQHPLQGGDASALRQVAATWIADGTAKLDHTSLVSGGTGETGESESIVEVIYPTEYIPGSTGEWARPSSFETRNIGYSFHAGDMQAEKGGIVLTGGMSYTAVLPDQQLIPDRLTQETKKTGDVFIPRFRTGRLMRQQEIATPEGVAKDESAAGDPFRPTPERMKEVDLQFDAGRSYVARMTADDHDPAAIVERLIFYRGATRPGAVPPDRTLVPDDYQMNCRIYRVDQRSLSDWLHGRDLATVPDLAFQMADEWSKDGRAEITGSLSGAGRPGLESGMENIVEVIYPTEYECPDPTPSPDGKGMISHFAIGTSFETRNTGLTLKCNLVAGGDEPKLKVSVDRCLLLGMSVVHRILVDGDWKENMTMPIFATNHWTNELHLNRGKWQLLGVCGDYSPGTRQADPAHCLIAFVKVE